MGGGEPVSSGSTWLWSSLDHGSRSDMNRERSSHHTAHLVTLLQDSLTDNALNVSPLGFECPLKKQADTGKLRKTKEVLLIFLWMLTGQRWVPLSLVLHLFSLFYCQPAFSCHTSPPSPLHAERMSFWALSHLPCLIQTFGLGFGLNQNYRCKRYLGPLFAPNNQNLIKLIEVVLVLIILNQWFGSFAVWKHFFVGGVGIWDQLQVVGTACYYIRQSVI